MRDSGMPEEAYWESLSDISLILDRLRVDRAFNDVAEFGCGYGTFTLPVAQGIAGIIDAQMIARTQERAKAAGVSNLRLHLRDALADGFGLPESSRDAVMLLNILHAEQSVKLLTRAARLLRPGSRPDHPLALRPGHAAWTQPGHPPAARADPRVGE